MNLKSKTVVLASLFVVFHLSDAEGMLQQEEQPATAAFAGADDEFLSPLARGYLAGLGEGNSQEDRSNNFKDNTACGDGCDDDGAN